MDSARSAWRRRSANAGRAGTILTVDILHAERPIYWNSIADADGPRSRLELLEPWSDLVEDHVVFLRGDVDDRARAARARANPLRVPRRRAHLRRRTAGAGFRRGAPAGRRRDRLRRLHAERSSRRSSGPSTSSERAELRARDLRELARARLRVPAEILTRDFEGLASASPRVRTRFVGLNDLRVVGGIDLPEGENRQAVGACLERANDRPGHANRVPLLRGRCARRRDARGHFPRRRRRSPRPAPCAGARTATSRWAQPAGSSR